MAELRNILDVGRRLYNCGKEFFDIFTILDASPRFVNYAKTTTGFIQFFRHELPYQRVRFHDDNKTILLQYGQVWLHVEMIDFLQMIFRPFFHCSWDVAATEIRDTVMRGEVSPSAIKFLHNLLVPQLQIVGGGVRLEDVPEDWRDLVVDYIRKGAVDLSKYSSVKALEHRVDQLEGLLEPDDSPLLESQLLPLPEEPTLPEEEREILAKTLRLDPTDFKTKRQAMELYAEANR